MLTALSFSCFAQSKHAAIWYVGGYSFDFNSEPPTITKLTERNDFTTRWYVDGVGNHVLTESKGEIFDENLKRIGNIDEFNFNEYDNRGFFVPVPTNENLVYFFDLGNCYLIDIRNKTVTKTDVKIDIGYLSHISVHHSLCDRIWLIATDLEEWTEYLLSEDGIKKVRTICLASDNYKYKPTTAKIWQINLSMDCKHYTMCNMSKNYSEVYYGDFDRETGLFTRKVSYDFEEDFEYIYNSIIAPDNSRIYYTAFTHERHFQIFEVQIVDGLPKFEKKKPLVDQKVALNGYCGMYYAIDGKIYVFETARKLCSTLSVNDNNETEYRQIYNFDRLFPVNYKDYLSSWFMDLPCYGAPPIDPCENISTPDIHFENSFVCQGNRLNVVCPNDGDYSFSYTYDGMENRVDDIQDGCFSIGEQSGIYKITKVSSGSCEFILQEPQIGEIGREIPSPVIIQESSE